MISFKIIFYFENNYLIIFLYLFYLNVEKFDSILNGYISEASNLQHYTYEECKQVTDNKTKEMLNFDTYYGQFIILTLVDEFYLKTLVEKNLCSSDSVGSPL